MRRHSQVAVEPQRTFGMLAAMSDRYEQIAKLNQLRADGALTDAEFAEEKAKLLTGNASSLSATESNVRKPWGMEVHVFCMVMHLSQFSSFFVPLLGVVFPVVMWATEKEKNETIDRHGRIIINWIISSIIYAIISALLCFIIIGIPLLIALVIASIVFTIMGAVKANDGKTWAYPLSLSFMSLPPNADDDQGTPKVDEEVAPPLADQ
jgi:uncharacterized protein